MDMLLTLFTQNFARLIGTVIYGVIGLLLSIIGYLSFKAIIPFDVDKGMTEKENIAVGIIIAGMIVGVSIIVAVSSYEPAPIVVTLPVSSSTADAPEDAGCGNKLEKAKIKVGNR